MATSFESICVEAPCDVGLVDRVVRFWESIFEIPMAEVGANLKGKENSANDNWLFVLLEDDEPVGTCHLTISKLDRRLGGLGEVAVAPSCRGQGIAGHLCAEARDRFYRKGGRALFLGTVMPSSARVYQRLGWRQQFDSNVYLWTPEADSSTRFYDDYFARRPGPMTVRAGTAEDRLAIIPPILFPNDCPLLDVNLGLVSTRFAARNSCMGLYPRYESLSRSGGGQWLVLQNASGSVVGAATARLVGEKTVRVDGFTHPDYAVDFDLLLDGLLESPIVAEAQTLEAVVAEADGLKQDRFHRHGFETVRSIDSEAVFPAAPELAETIGPLLLLRKTGC